MSDDNIHTSWIDHSAIEPMYAYRCPAQDTNIQFRRYEYGFLDIAVTNEDNDIVEAATLEKTKIGHLARFLSWVVDNDDDHTYYNGGMEFEAKNTLYIHRYVSKYNPQTDDPYPANQHNSDEPFDPDDDEVHLPRGVAPSLLEFIQNTNELRFEGVTAYTDQYEAVEFPR